MFSKDDVLKACDDAGVPKELIKPRIIVSNDELAINDMAVEALANNPDVYQRDFALAEILRDPVTQVSRIRPIPPAVLREMLADAADWCVIKVDKRTGEQSIVPARVPDTCVKAIHARGHWDGIRPLAGIVDAPVLRADGTILDMPGYDFITRNLYQPAIEFPSVPAQPTQLDARKAYADLLEPFADFPFVSDSHRAVPIAAILTLLGRPAIQGPVPMFLADASTRGCGKSKIQSIVGFVACGRDTSKLAYPSDDAELEKLLGSVALTGQRIADFDNVSRPFGGGALDRCITAADTVQLRILGRSEAPEVQWRVVVLGSGNNLQLAGDTSRRCLVSRLESDLENPEQRTEFQHPDLLEWVQANRARLVIAGLTILKAHALAGRPSCGVAKWGSFEAWSRIIPAAIVWAGGANPMRTRQELESTADAEKSVLAALIHGWEQLDPRGNGLTASEAIRLLYPAQKFGVVSPIDEPAFCAELRAAMESACQMRGGRIPDAHALGTQLRKHRRRVVGGRAFDCDQRQGTAVWRVIGKAKQEAA